MGEIRLKTTEMSPLRIFGLPIAAPRVSMSRPSPASPSAIDLGRRRASVAEGREVRRDLVVQGRQLSDAARVVGGPHLLCDRRLRGLGEGEQLVR